MRSGTFQLHIHLENQWKSKNKLLFALLFVHREWVENQKVHQKGNIVMFVTFIYEIGRNPVIPMSRSNSFSLSVNEP